VILDRHPDADGTYPNRTLVTLESRPTSANDKVDWAGVDGKDERLAVVYMTEETFVTVYLYQGSYDLIPIYFRQSSPFYVTKTYDTLDGVCDDDCSIREALEAAEAGDTIFIPSGTYTLTINAELSIDKELTLTGAGPYSTIIQAATQPVVALARVIRILAIGDNVSISGVVIRNGNIKGDGGGIWNNANLTLANTVVTGNTALSRVGLAGTGGGIYNSGGSVTLIGSTVTENFAQEDGGAIYNRGGTITLNDSTVTGNFAPSGLDCSGC